MFLIGKLTGKITENIINVLSNIIKVNSLNTHSLTFGGQHFHSVMFPFRKGFPSET